MKTHCIIRNEITERLCQKLNMDFSSYVAINNLLASKGKDLSDALESTIEYEIKKFLSSEASYPFDAPNTSVSDDLDKKCKKLKISSNENRFYFNSEQECSDFIKNSGYPEVGFFKYKTYDGKPVVFLRRPHCEFLRIQRFMDVINYQWRGTRQEKNNWIGLQLNKELREKGWDCVQYFDKKQKRYVLVRITPNPNVHVDNFNPFSLFTQDVRDSVKLDKEYKVEDIKQRLKTYVKASDNELFNNKEGEQLLDKILNAASKLGISYYFYDNLPTTGRTISSKIILLNAKHLNPNALLHETIHAVTSYYLNQKDISKLDKNVQKAISVIKSTHQQLLNAYVDSLTEEQKKLYQEDSKKFLIDNDKYYLTNEQELVAELSNPDVVEMLSNIDTEEKNRTLLNKIIDAILKFFGINTVTGNLKQALDYLVTYSDIHFSDEYFNQFSNINIDKYVNPKDVKISSSELNNNSPLLLEEAYTSFNGFEEDKNYTLDEYVKEVLKQSTFDNPNGYELNDLYKSIISSMAKEFYLHTASKNMTLFPSFLEHFQSKHSNDHSVQSILDYEFDGGERMQQINKAMGEFNSLLDAIEYEKISQQEAASRKEAIKAKYSRVLSSTSSDESIEETPSKELGVKPTYQTITNLTLKTSNGNIQFDYNTEQFNKEDFIKSLNSLINKDSIPIGATIDLTNLPVDDNFIKVLKHLKSLEKEDLFYGYYNGTSSFDKLDEEQKKLLRENGFNYIPIFRFALTQDEVKDMEAQSVLFNNDLFKPTELNAWARTAMMYLSKRLFVLSEDERAKNAYFGNEMFKNESFVGLSNLEILNKIGLRTALEYLVKEPIFNPEKNPAALDAFDLYDKLEIVYNNFDTFIKLGYETLADLEGIAMDGSDSEFIDKQNFNSEDANLDNETEQELQEVFGSSAETWQVGFRQLSAHASLSRLLKLRLGKLYELDENGDIVKDDLGLDKTIDVHEAVNKILFYTKGSLNLNDKNEDGTYKDTSMVGKLQAQLKKEKWLEQVVGSYSIDGQNTLKGFLVSELAADEQLSSQFYTNFQKNFQKYTILFKDNSTGKLLFKTLNENDYVEKAVEDLRGKVNSKEVGNLSLWDSKTNSWRNVELDKIVKAIGPNAQYSKDVLGHIKDLYNLLDIVLPEDSILEDVFRTVDLRKLFNAASGIVRNLTANKNNAEFNPLSARANLSDYKTLLSYLSVTEGSKVEPCVYEDGKLHYGYVLPSYVTKYVDRLSGNVENYDEWLDSEFGQYTGWFKDEDGRWLNYWLDRLSSDKDVRKNFEHVTSLADRGTGYTDKTPKQYMASMIGSYFYAGTNNNYSYFRIPTMSNKPSEEYIKAPNIKYDFENEIASQIMKTIFIAEVNRIRAVKARRNNIQNKELLVENFDKRGDKFLFLEFLQEEIDKETQLGRALEKYIDGDTSGNLELVTDSDTGTTYSTESEYVVAKVKEKILNNINDKYEKFKQDGRNNGLFSFEEGTTNIRRVNDEALDLTLGGDVENAVREFYFNDYFAQLNMQPILIGDIAFYKNAEDLQKRLAQLHAPSMKPNVNATVNGEKVSADGKFRTLYIKDCEVVSDIIPNLERAKEIILSQDRYKNNPNLARMTRDILDNTINQFKNINWADAQAYTSPTGYRKRMAMFGKWDSNRDEQVYKKALEADYDNSDLSIVWQPLKPFGYSQIGINGYNETMPKIKMGVQNKNSEYLLLKADAILRAGGIKSKLTAMFDIMEESAKRFPGRGIDAIQFESTVKTGKRGVIDINSLDYDGVKKAFSDRMYINGQYNTDYVQEYPFEDYGIQQEVPAHFKSAQQHGSQVRILVAADFANTDSNGNPNYIKVKNDKGQYEDVTVEQAKQTYFEAIANNIELSRKEIEDRFKLNTPNQKLKNIALSRLLKEEILKDARYGSDLLWGCSLNSEGEFNIPLDDPIQSTRIQQLLNSIIKNKIWKQKIAGGPVVQVSSFGTSEDLSIVFKDKNGNEMLTRKEFKGTDNEFLKYLKDNMDSVAYFECYLPLFDDSLLTDFPDGKGGVDIEALKKANPKLLDMLGYRIPTESKYSMIPIKVKGFLPKEAGEGIMMPKEITLLSGSDFDIDKLYIMRYSFNKKPKFKKTTIKQIADFLNVDYAEVAKELYSNNSNLTQEQKRQVHSIGDRQVKYDYVMPTQGRQKNNNTIIDYSLGFLTAQSAMEQFFTPGNFEKPKRIGYLITAMDNTGRTYEDLNKESTSTLKDLAITSKNLLYAQTQVDFHKQNMIAAKLIGIFALANVSHAFTNMLEPQYRQFEINPKKGFVIDGIQYFGSIYVDDEYMRNQLTRISNELAAFLAASVDAVKDPILNLLGINMDTVNILSSLVRMGVDTETICFMLTHPAIRNLMNQYQAQDEVKSFGKFLKTRLSEMESIEPNLRNMNTTKMNFTKQYFIDNHNRLPETQLTEEAKGAYIYQDYAVLSLIDNILNEVVPKFADILTITRCNSVSSAPGPFIVDTIYNKNKITNAIYNEKNPIPQILRTQQPILRAFIDSVYNATSNTNVTNQIFSGNFKLASPVFGNSLEQLQHYLGNNLDNNTVRDFADFYTSYDFVKNGDVFDMSVEHQKEVIYNFPNKFLQFIAYVNSNNNVPKNIKDNLLLKAVKLNMDGTGFRFLSLNTRGYDNNQIANLKLAWTELYNYNKEIALDLVEYNFFRGSFAFSPKTFMRLVPNSIKKAIPNYERNVKKAPSEISGDAIRQFLLNTGRAELYADSKGTINLPEVDDSNCYNDYLVKLPNGKYIIVNAYGNVINDNVPKLGGQEGQSFEIYPGASISEIASIHNAATATSQQQKPTAIFDTRKNGNIAFEDIQNIFTKSKSFANLNESINDIMRTWNDNVYDVFNFRYGLSKESTSKIKETLQQLNKIGVTLEDINNTLKQLNLC